MNLHVTLVSQLLLIVSALFLLPLHVFKVLLKRCMLTLQFLVSLCKQVELFLPGLGVSFLRLCFCLPLLHLLLETVHALNELCCLVQLSLAIEQLVTQAVQHLSVAITVLTLTLLLLLLRRASLHVRVLEPTPHFRCVECAANSFFHALPQSRHGTHDVTSFGKRCCNGLHFQADLGAGFTNGRAWM